MRALIVGCSLVAVLAATPAVAGSFVKPMGKIILYQPSDTDDNDVPMVAPGQQLGINCGCMGSGASDVRVVLNIDNDEDSDDAPIGYKKLLATDQSIKDGVLRVRVPNAPGLANHTVDVEVYVVDATSAHACKAGKVRIT